MMESPPPPYANHMNYEEVAVAAQVIPVGHANESTRNDEDARQFDQLTRHDDGDRSQHVQHNGRHEHHRHTDDNRIQARDDITQPDGDAGYIDRQRQNNTERNIEDLIIELHTASNTFTGFVIIMHETKKLPRSSFMDTVYKLGVLIYFFANLTYSIVATALQREHFPYHVVYMSVSLIGFVFELVVMIFTIVRCLRGDDDDDNDDNVNQGENRGASEQVQIHYGKARKVAVDYLISSLAEFLIYPTLICVMYGFINERAWQFDNGLSGCYFILFAYSVIIDAMYMKFYVIVLVIRVLRATYVKYDELAKPGAVEWKRYFTPVYLSILFSIATGLTHWTMTGIIAVRIYVDNFSTENENSTTPNTGDYRVAIFTRYMVACTIFLPIVSWITYIIINKSWFYEIYSAISALEDPNYFQRLQNLWDANRSDWQYKLFNFIKNPSAYIAIVLSMLAFIAFAVGSYLVDYNSSDYELELTEENAVRILRFCFIGLFLLSNLQAAIVFSIVLLLIVLIIPFGLPIMCGVCLYNHYCS